MQTRDYRWLWGSVLACAVLIYVYPLVLPTPLLDPDEGLHAAISQEMVENGDYLTPRVQGVPFLDKPILCFAAQALSLQTFGMNESAVRLPGLLFALAGVGTTALLARQLFDRATGLVTLLVALTLGVPLALAQSAAHDVALVPWTNLLLLCWWEADRDGSLRRRALFTVSAGLLVTLALLTKGLIGVAVASVGYCFFVLLNRQISLPWLTRLAGGLLLGSLLASPWFIMMEHRAPGYLYYYFVERHVGGFATATQQHGGEPWYYYLPIVVGGTMPWMLLMLPGLWQEWIHRRQSIREDLKPTTFLLCWLIGGLLFLSLASSKLITYALPLFPAVAILVGHSVRQFLDRRLSARIDTAFAKVFQFVCAIGCVLPLAALCVLDSYNRQASPTSAYMVALLAGLTVLAAILLVHSERRHEAVAIGSLWVALLFACLMTWPLQRTAEQYTQRSLGLELAERSRLPQQILLVGGRVASVLFYLTPEQRQQLQEGQLIAASPRKLDTWATIPRDTLLAITGEALARLRNPVVKRFAETVPSEGVYRMIEPSGSLARKPRNHSW